MLQPLAALLVTFGALALFAAVGVLAARRFGVEDRDRYLTARRSQGPGSLALSLFASALGTWILLAPPEVGTFGGLLGILGYAAGQALAVAVFAALGPAVLGRLPEGATILEFVRFRFGRVQQAYVGAISILYMFVFITAELTAVGFVLGIVGGVDPAVPVVAVAGVTVAYTAYGGLPASIATDRWQAWLILGLVAVAGIAIVGPAVDPVRALDAGGAWDVNATGAELFVVLVIAVVAANLFHQGFWQRAWAARDRRALVGGALGGGALIVPVIVATGLAGAMAAGVGRVDQPSLAFFSLLEGLPGWVLAVVVALAVALVASTTDTLENALTSIVGAHLAGGRMSLAAARTITVLVTVPAVVVALRGVSILRLFLIADLLAATIAFPVFLGLWRRTTASAALAGSAAGLAGVVVLGWVRTGSLWEGALLLTLPGTRLDLGAFLVAPAASALVTVGLSLLGGRESAVPEEATAPTGPDPRLSRRGPEGRGAER